jgi:hypothetical protein
MYDITWNIQLQVFYTLEKLIIKAVELNTNVKINVIKRLEKTARVSDGASVQREVLSPIGETFIQLNRIQKFFIVSRLFFFYLAYNR